MAIYPLLAFLSPIVLIYLTLRQLFITYDTKAWNQNRNKYIKLLKYSTLHIKDRRSEKKDISHFAKHISDFYICYLCRTYKELLQFNNKAIQVNCWVNFQILFLIKMKIVSFLSSIRPSQDFLQLPLFLSNSWPLFINYIFVAVVVLCTHTYD